jgi:hypothetical protein
MARKMGKAENANMVKEDDYLEFQYELKVSVCPCGSGRDPAKCCGPVKPRTHTVRLDRRNYTESDGLAIGMDYSLKRIVGGQILPLIGVPIFVQTHGRTQKSPKVIVKGETAGDFVMKPDSVLTRFDNYFVIDTNTRELHGQRISMSAVLHAHVRDDHLLYAPMTAFEFWGAEIDPEILGWYVLIRSIEERGLFLEGRIGLIVDSHLGELDEFNRRERAIFGDQLLPERMKFIYASADKSGSTANTLIKQADLLASSQLKSVAKSSDMDTLKSTSYPCQFFRQWLP